MIKASFISAPFFFLLLDFPVFQVFKNINRSNVYERVNDYVITRGLILFI